MNCTESWNEIVNEYNKNRNAKEEIVQNSWEMLLKWVFGYSDKDIDSKRNIKMGATMRGEPDIIVRKNGGDMFVVELKQYTKHDGREQLFSYLNQLKMNIGIVVCESLYLYDYDFTEKTPTPSLKFRSFPAILTVRHLWSFSAKAILTRKELRILSNKKTAQKATLRPSKG